MCVCFHQNHRSLVRFPHLTGDPEEESVRASKRHQPLKERDLERMKGADNDVDYDDNVVVVVVVVGHCSPSEKSKRIERKKLEL